MHYPKVVCRQESIKMRSIVLLMMILTACHNQTPQRFGFGRTATLREIDSLNISIAPDGKGLPAGAGNAATGQLIYTAKCAACHGITGTEVATNRLVATFGDTTVKSKAIGNYWPYATTIFDYIRRAMPYNAPGSLTNEEVYSLTAFLLWRNNIIDSTKEINAHNLAAVIMPAKKLYINDDRRGGDEVR
jgi:mono/diheme cytochrome c family protein